jgi:hypothetical protein
MVIETLVANLQVVIFVLIFVGLGAMTGLAVYWRGQAQDEQARRMAGAVVNAMLLEMVAQGGRVMGELEQVNRPELAEATWGQLPPEVQGRVPLEMWRVWVDYAWYEGLAIMRYSLDEAKKRAGNV